MTVRMRDIKALRRELGLHAKLMDERDRFYTERYKTQQQALEKAFDAAAAVALAWALGKWGK